GFSRTSAGTPSPSIRRIRAVRRLRAICRFDLCTAELPRRDGRVLACSRMREHFSIKREDSQTEPRHNGPLGRPALQVRDLRVSSHKIPSAHFLHPDSTLESLIRHSSELVYTMALSANSRLAALGGYGHVDLYELASGRRIRRFQCAECVIG